MEHNNKGLAKHYYEKMKFTEYMFEQSKKVNQIYMDSMIYLKNDYERASSTKAWKIMCLLRRIKEQLLKGTFKEKKKFFIWIKLKLLKKPIPNELELSNYSPIILTDINKVIDFIETEVASASIPETQSLSIGNYDYIRYNTPSKVDIFRFPVIEWDFRWQRPQQLSVQFAENGHRVFYFSLDTCVMDSEQITYETIKKNIIIKELQSNVWWVKLCTNSKLNPYKDILSSPFDIKYLQWSIEALKERFNISQTLSIIDLPFWATLAFSLDQNKVVYDCMDDHAGFSTNSPEMLEKEESLLRNADLVITSSQRLYDKVNKYNNSNLLVRNATEYKHFSQAPTELASELGNINNPIIGYYGAISEWFDIELIAHLAKRNKEWTFILIGNTFGCDISKVINLNNVILTGEKEYQELPKYLYGFDVCLIPFIINDLTLATNPVKVYEYLASGKPVVSTKLPELNPLSDLVYLASNYEEFERMINYSLKENDKEIAKRRKEFAKRNSWESRYEQINNLINLKFYPKVSIVIVTYNNWTYTKQCLESLFKNNNYPNVEIIVVDNNSTDETRIELARIQHPQLKLIFSPSNKGFAGGNLIGCQASTGDYIILLNNDTIVTAGWIEKLIRPFKDDPKLGMVGPVSNSVGNDQMLDFFVGDSLNGASQGWLRDFESFYRGSVRNTDLLGFFCVAIKREVYDKVGDLDTNYGIGMFEDDDYCERVKNLGYKLGIAEDVFIYHHGSVSFKKLKDKVYQETWERNKKYFEEKWQKKWQLPNRPLNIFNDAFDTDEVSKRVKLENKKSVLILGDLKWSEEPRRYQYLVKELIKEDILLIVYIQSYLERDLIGIRKAGKSVYFTNRIDLLEKVHFDFVLYSGLDHTISKTKTASVGVDYFSYEKEEIEKLFKDPQIRQFKEEDIQELSRLVINSINS